MANWNKLLWGGLGWAVGGPIGGIIGVVIGAVVDEATGSDLKITSGTRPGDFGAALLVLCAAVMKSDNRMLKSELEFVKSFFIKQFGVEQAKERMLLFREILKQDYSLEEVTTQIRHNLDYPARLQLLHLLFGLAFCDNELHLQEIAVIDRIADYLGIESKDYGSIKAMFIKDNESAYKILEIEPTASDAEVKKAYRLMAIKFHPDKVHHLGPEFQTAAHEKFKSISEAYEKIKKERNIG